MLVLSVVAPIEKAYLGKFSNVLPTLVSDVSLVIPTRTVLILDNVTSLVPLVKLEIVSASVCGLALSVVPSSTVPSLLPNTAVNNVLSRDASSGVNESSVCACILADTRLLTSTSPNTAQPAG